MKGTYFFVEHLATARIKSTLSLHDMNDGHDQGMAGTFMLSNRITTELISLQRTSGIGHTASSHHAGARRVHDGTPA